MRSDKRHAAVAYGYAWWMTGEEGLAVAALTEALQAASPRADPGDDEALVTLMHRVRTALGDARPMPPASELALLHDGFGVPLDSAAQLAGVATDDAPLELAQGRLEALLETVRENFTHVDRLGGLAVGDPADVAHSQDCPSCGRARTLIERGRAELQAVAPVSAPPGLIAGLVAQTAPEPEDEPEAEPEAEPEPAADTIAVHEILDEPGEYAVAGDDVTAAPRVEDEAADVEIVLDPVPGPGTETDTEIILDEVDEDVVEGAPPTTEPEDARRIPVSGRRRAAMGVLAAAGLVTLCALVVVGVATGGPDEQPQPTVPTEQPALGQDGGQAEESEPPRRRPERTEGQFGPPAEGRRGFAVVGAGLILPGEENAAPSGAVLGAEEPVRIAVDYENGAKGARLGAIWRVDEEPFDRLEAVVSAKASRHVWGVPVPPGGWPPGQHRIVITANDGVAGAIDFTVEPSE